MGRDWEFAELCNIYSVWTKQEIIVFELLEEYLVLKIN